jgi:GT2 family glycosyltransferase
MQRETPDPRAKQGRPGPDSCDGTFVWIDPVDHAWTGGKMAMELEIVNRSENQWPARGPKGVRFSIRWFLSPGDKSFVPEARPPLEVNVEPGESRRIRVVVDIPDSAGPATLTIVPMQLGKWFNKFGFENPKWRLELRDSRSVAAGTIRVATPMSKCLAGATVPMAVELTNQSTTVWSPALDKAFYPRLMARWVRTDSRGRPGGERPDPARQLPAPLSPEDVICWHHDATAPEMPGFYRVAVGVQVPAVSLAEFVPTIETVEIELEVQDPVAIGKPERGALLKELSAAGVTVDSQVHSRRVQLQLDLMPAAAAQLMVSHPQPADLALCRPDIRSIESDRIHVFMPEGFVLSAQAPTLIAGAFASNPSTAVVFGDWDVLEPEGLRHSPSLNLPADVICSREAPGMGPVIAMRAELARQVLQVPAEPEFDAQYHLELRVLELVERTRISHLPTFLAHWVGTGHYLQSQVALMATVRAHLDRQGVLATVLPIAGLPRMHVRYELPANPPKVALIIPTRDHWEMIQPCLAGILNRTDYPNLEILVLDHETVEPAARFLLDGEFAAGRISMIPYKGEFSWADMNNVGVAHTDAQVVCLLNNDTEPVHESWLREMVGLALQPSVGAVGAALWYDDGQLQHGGVRLGINRYADHFEKDVTRSEWRHRWGAQVRSLSAITGACLVARREVYEAAGGMDANYMPIAVNDIDFCLRVRERLGLSVMWTPHAELWHYESKSRGKAESDDERSGVLRSRRAFWARWYDWIQEDPAYSTAIDALKAFPAVKTRTPLNGMMRRSILHDSPRIAFMHIPKTAGVALRAALTQGDYGSVLVLSPRSLIQSYDRDPITIDRLAQRARQTDLWFSHFRQGLGELFGVPCWYATVLRDPVERLVSHYKHLITGMSPIAEKPLAQLPIRDLLALGVLPGNLMSDMILGGRSEQASWQTISEGPCLHNASYCGFSLPEWVWQGHDGPPEGAMVAPVPVDALPQVLAVIEQKFAFIGRQDCLYEHCTLLGDQLGLGKTALMEMNVNSSAKDLELSAEDTEAIAKYAALDIALWNHITALEGGLFIRQERLAQTRMSRWSRGDLKD